MRDKFCYLTTDRKKTDRLLLSNIKFAWFNFHEITWKVAWLFEGVKILIQGIWDMKMWNFQQWNTKGNYSCAISLQAKPSKERIWTNQSH